jgi:hypothetical protein
MKVKALVFLFLSVILISSCKKTRETNVGPSIEFVYFGPTATAPYSYLRTNVDSAVLVFKMADADGDLGNSRTGADIYVKDARFDTAGFIGYSFPQDIDTTIEDPNKGITGTCTFYFIPALISPRADSVHIHGDTTRFVVYIMDRAGHKSDSIVTPTIIIK